MKRIILISVGLMVLLAATIWAAVPQLINFQGILRDGSGNPVGNGNYSVRFRIYNDPTVGNVLWSESTSVSTTGGLFAVLLGSSNPVPDSAFNSPGRWLGIAVAPDGEMPMRQQLVSVGYAYRVNSVDSASGGTISGGLTLSSGNLNLDNSSSTAGNIRKGGALFIHNFGTDNTFIGPNAGNLTMTGTDNTASGVNALRFNTTGSDNTASGANALGGNTTGFSNTACGNFALLNNTTGHGNTASGDEALSSNTTGINNTANGTRALTSNTTGFNNTASGSNALGGNTTGSANTACGTNALSLNTTGFNNTASGFGALVGNTTGNDNTASGLNVLSGNTTGFENTASGSAALQLNTTGNRNTASGALALQSNTTGDSNTASGRSALSSNTTGSNNTAIGFFANVSAGNLNNATAIGAGAMVDASNKIRLGNAAVTVIEGQVAYTFPSDKNQKENFRPVDGEEVLRKIRGFNLASWNYIGHDPKQFRHYGPMAQEFYAAFGNDGVGTIGTPTTINSGDMAGILMAAVQALGNENADLKARIEQLEEKLKGMQDEKPQAKVR